MYVIYIWRVIYRVALCMFVTIPSTMCGSVYMYRQVFTYIYNMYI